LSCFDGDGGLNPFRGDDDVAGTDIHFADRGAQAGGIRRLNAKTRHASLRAGFGRNKSL
jgi:hypothetical protein